MRSKKYSHIPATALQSHVFPSNGKKTASVGRTLGSFKGCVETFRQKLASTRANAHANSWLGDTHWSAIFSHYILSRLQTYKLLTVCI